MKSVAYLTAMMILYVLRNALIRKWNYDVKVTLDRKGDEGKRRLYQQQPIINCFILVSL